MIVVGVTDRLVDCGAVGDSFFNAVTAYLTRVRSKITNNDDEQEKASPPGYAFLRSGDCGELAVGYRPCGFD